MKTDLFESCGHCWVFQICWHIDYNTFTASSFRIWKSSTGILSPPLVLFIVMLPKAHLTSHSRMSGSRWVIILLWLFGSWRSFLYSFSVLPRERTGNSKRTLPTTQEKALHMDISRWSIPKSDWLYSLQPKMENLYKVSKNKTGSWLLLRSWTPYRQIQT